jgi:hypothetical protein
MISPRITSKITNNLEKIRVIRGEILFLLPKIKHD